MIPRMELRFGPSVLLFSFCHFRGNLRLDAT